jgi:hypothetical protein|tara:strand:+ start:3646 stop:3957 length:312 start_codon:yes stop_codon:yes gene_type:complete
MDKKRIPMTQEEEYRNAGVPMPKSEYEYKYTEQSVDVRTWTITSPTQLTEEEVQEIGTDWGSFTEGETSIVEDDNYPKCKVFFDGVEYGDDTQTEVEGDTKDE